MANIYAMSDTWNASGTTFTAIKMNVTDTDSAADSLLMDLQVGGTSKFSVAKTGNLTVGRSIDSYSGFGNSSLDLANQAASIYTLSSGRAFLFNASGFTVPSTACFINFGTTTFGGNPDLSLTRDAANTLAQRNGTNAQTFNLYNTYTDASNYERARFQWSGNELRIGTEASGTGSIRSTGLYIGNTRYQIMGSGFNQFDQNLYMNGADIATSTSGFKIGTASTQGLGFWGATPSAQPTAVADATDAASVITQLNELLSRLRTIGLIAT